MRAQFQAGEDKIEESIIAKYKLKLEKTTIADVPVLIIQPPVIKPGNEAKIMFNIHGGGFIMGTARDRSALLMSAEMGIRVYSIDYTLAPEAQYPVARDQCMPVYRHLVKTFEPKNIFGMSSSAGGQLMLSMLVLAQQENLPMVAGLVFYTPGADLSESGDSITSNASRDVMHPSFALQLAKQNYIGKYTTSDPLVSPIYADFKTGFPPSVITTGTRDMLMSAGIRLSWKLREVSSKVELLVSDGMWHGFNWEVEMPEAIRVRAAVLKFLNELS